MAQNLAFQGEQPDTFTGITQFSGFLLNLSGKGLSLSILEWRLQLWNVISWTPKPIAICVRVTPSSLDRAAYTTSSRSYCG